MGTVGSILSMTDERKETVMTDGDAREMLRRADRYGLALETVLPAHRANGTAITWWRFVGRKGSTFELGHRVQSALIRENAS